MNQLERTANKYAHRVLATIIGVLLIIGFSVSIYLAVAPVWLSSLFILLGLFLIFPMRVTDFIKLVGDKLPNFGNK